MAVLPAAPPIDVERFYALTRDWRERAELIDGEVVVVPAPSFFHQDVLKRLFRTLDAWAAEGPNRGVIFFAPIDVRLDEHTVVQPDVAWWAGDLDLHAQPGPPPHLAVEVLSPTSRRRDTLDKRVAYARAGVPELWLVDPDTRAVTTLRAPDPERADYLELNTVDAASVLDTPLLPGLVVTVAQLFPPR